MAFWLFAIVIIARNSAREKKNFGVKGKYFQAIFGVISRAKTIIGNRIVSRKPIIGSRIVQDPSKFGKKNVQNRYQISKARIGVGGGFLGENGKKFEVNSNEIRRYELTEVAACQWFAAEKFALRGVLYFLLLLLLFIIRVKRARIKKARKKDADTRLTNFFDFGSRYWLPGK